MIKILLFKFLDIEVNPILPDIDPNEETLKSLTEKITFWGIILSIFAIIITILLIIIIYKINKNNYKKNEE